MDAELLVSSQGDDYVDLFDLSKGDRRWQAQAAQGFAARDLTLDWERCKAICPSGKESIEWLPAIDRRKTRLIKIKFSTADCSRCIHRTACTHPVRSRRRLTVRPEDQYFALREARTREAD